MAAIKKIEIGGSQRDMLLAADEDNFMDFKAIEIAPSKLTNTLSALANSIGGDVYIGIDESDFMGSKIRQWNGFKDQEAANSHIQVIESVFPFGSEYVISFLRALGSNGLVLHVSIQKTTEIVRATNKRAYIRRGAQNLEVKGVALKRLELDKGIQSFENQTVDIDIAGVVESETLENFVTQVVPNLKPLAFLKRQHLIKSNKPVVSSVLLFADEPQAALPKRSGIKLFRYKTSDEASRDLLAGDPISIEGPIYTLITESVAQTVSLVEGLQKLGPSGLEPVNYPIETLHEIVTNAVLHRDYSIAADIMIRVFDNRIEVESPGTLPGHVTVKNIRDEQFARNGTLVRLINKFPNPPNKDVGEGITTAFSAMHKLRLKPPVIIETEASVEVVIKHESLASPEEMVMDYLQIHDEIRNSVARKITGITSENSMKEVFYRLAESDLLERVPEKRGAASAWRKKSND